MNRQSIVRIDVRAARGFAGQVRKALRLGRREFNVCFVDDRAIRTLNRAYRSKARPTDVLSFAWNGAGRGNGRRSAVRTPPRQMVGKRERANAPHGEFEGFLGDIVISAETSRRNARRAGHSAANEIRRLILHGALHLLGYDHETDDGEMERLESKLRRELGIDEVDGGTTA